MPRNVSWDLRATCLLTQGALISREEWIASLKSAPSIGLGRTVLATNIVMPKMGYDMREGTVVRWHKSEGESVSRGDVIADIETDKATVEFEAFTSGILRKILVQEGLAVPVGELIAVIAAPDEELPADLGIVIGDVVVTETPSQNADTLAPVAATSVVVQREVRVSPIARRLARERGIDLELVTGTGPGGRIVEKDVVQFAPQGAASASSSATPDSEVRASPIARRLARERGIALSVVLGTGPGGRIVEKDVLGYTPSAAEQEPVVQASADSTGPERVELSRMRQAIARVTSDSKRDAPHFYVTSEIDMTRAMRLRREINDSLSGNGRVSVNDLIVKACALALGRYPKFNGSFQGDHLLLNPSINIGIAIALEEGLIVPGIDDCQSKSLVQIAASSKDLNERAHSGTLRNEEYSGTTFSVSNLGMFDVDSFAAIIFPPHAAVLAVGSVKEQPVVRDGELAVAQIMKATVSTDHRVADGAEAAQLVGEVKRLLENPLTLLI